MRFICICLFLLSGPIAAEGSNETRIEIDVTTDDGSVFMLDSATLDFDMTKMQVGENRSFTDTEGRNILLTRTDSGFTLDVDGRQIDLPGLLAGQALGDGVLLQHGDREEIEKAIRIAKEKHARQSSNHILISSSQEIDAATQDAIRMALKRGGYEKPVEFTNADSLHVERQVWISKTQEREQ